MTFWTASESFMSFSSIICGTQPPLTSDPSILRELQLSYDKHIAQSPI